MIALRKLASLEESTKLRKCARLLDELAWELRHAGCGDTRYIAGVCELVVESDDRRISLETREACRSIVFASSPIIWRQVADAASLLFTDLGMEKADWDFRDPHAGTLDNRQRHVLPFTVVLDRLRSPFNVGSVFRTADSFGVASLILVRPTASPGHQRSQRSARGCTETVDWVEASEEATIEKLADRPLFALELGGADLSQFRFPEAGSVIIGSEEFGVSPRLLALADRSFGRVSIPMHGTKGSLNVSVAFGILMHAWYTQAAASETEKPEGSN